MSLHPVLKEAKRLHKLGFAILWIKPKSKAPVKSKWTTGPRESWENLESSFKPGFNLGVRLGTPSKLAEGKYLAVLDIDVKSSEERHRIEAEKAVRELFPEIPKDVVQVMSGRGNGSSHIYILTPSPAAPSKRKVSVDKVKVKMPSAAINPAQRGLLSDEDLNEGFRMRPAWEVAVMGEGQQVLLPPSVHPDTGKNYAWKKRIERLDDLTILEIGRKEKQFERSFTFDWKPDVRDIFTSSLPNEIIDILVEGNVEDRSAALFKVAIAMIKEGWTDQQIMTALTDPNYALGEVAYEHAKTQSRERAANWIFNYTIKKARKETDANTQFEREVETVELDEAQAMAQEVEIAQHDWRSQIERNGPTGHNANKPRCSLKNVILVLENEVSKGVVQRNLFSNRDTYGCETPWGGKTGHAITDDDVVVIKEWFSNRFRFEPSLALIYEALTAIAVKNGFHPVRDYILSIEWDGVERLDTWLKDYVSAKAPEPYLSDVSRKIICAMVARVFQPGIKFDSMPVLEGDQGVGKSSAARILASEQWFADHLPDLRHPDARLNLQGKWVTEMGELASLKKSELETVKAYISSQSDHVRAPYGRKAMDLKRQSVFIGTTNESFYLKDKSGNRRYWPIPVGQCDFQGLQAVRDQLFAEAYFVWSTLGEKLWLEGESKHQAESLQATRMAEDEETVMAEKFDDFLEAELRKNGDSQFNFQGFRLSQLFDGFGPFSSTKSDMNHLLLAARILKSRGFEKYTSSGNSKWKLEKRH